jgi:hypothetical protein
MRALLVAVTAALATSCAGGSGDEVVVEVADLEPGGVDVFVTSRCDTFTFTIELRRDGATVRRASDGAVLGSATPERIAVACPRARRTRPPRSIYAGDIRYSGRAPRTLRCSIAGPFPTHLRADVTFFESGPPRATGIYLDVDDHAVFSAGFDVEGGYTSAAWASPPCFVVEGPPAMRFRR